MRRGGEATRHHAEAKRTSRNAKLAVSRLSGVDALELVKELQRQEVRGSVKGEVVLERGPDHRRGIFSFQEDKISVGIRKGLPQYASFPSAEKRLQQFTNLTHL